MMRVPITPFIPLTLRGKRVLRTIHEYEKSGPSGEGPLVVADEYAAGSASSRRRIGSGECEPVAHAVRGADTRRDDERQNVRKTGLRMDAQP